MNGPRFAAVLAWSIGTLAGLVLLGAAGVFGASEWMLRRSHDAPLEAFSAVAAPEELGEGRRMAIIVGCWAGCHGMQGEGGEEHMPGLFRLTAPTLSDVLPAYSDAELVRLIRYGVRRDGRTALGMISGTFYPLGDADLARIIAHLRRQPATPPVPRVRRVSMLGRLALVTGRWQTSAGEVDRTMPRWGALPRTTAYARGRYLASITCSECHGLDFRGEALEKSPSLAVAAAYPPEAFRRLMRTGVPVSGRDLGLMSWVARNAFTHFTDDEIADLHGFLQAYFGRPAPPAAAP